MRGGQKSEPFPVPKKSMLESHGALARQSVSGPRGQARKSTERPVLEACLPRSLAKGLTLANPVSKVKWRAIERDT